MSFNIFDIAGSGMTAQRVKMDTISSNIANIHTTRKPDGSKGVYVKKDVSFRTIYEDAVNRGFSNFQSNNPDAQFDPKTGNLLINANVALNTDVELVPDNYDIYTYYIIDIWTCQYQNMHFYPIR